MSADEEVTPVGPEEGAVPAVPVEAEGPVEPAAAPEADGDEDRPAGARALLVWRALRSRLQRPARADRPMAPDRAPDPGAIDEPSATEDPVPTGDPEVSADAAASEEPVAWRLGIVARRRSGPRAPLAPWSPWWRASLAIAVVAVSALVLDLVAPLLGPEDDAVIGALDPSAGGWVCSVGDDRISSDVDVSLTAVPRILAPGESSGPAIAGRGVVVTVGGIWRELDADPLLPAQHVVVDADVDEGAALWVGWADLPLVAWREWALAGSPDLPAGRVAGGCATAAAATQVVPGVRTDGGFETRLRLGNPFPEDAAVGIAFLTPAGVEQPLGLRNVSVPAFGTREVVVSEHLPQAADVAAVVSVGSGRVAVEGYQLARQAIGGVRGVSLLSASTAGSEEVTVPWVRDGTDVETWLWLANDGERPAVVEFAVHLPGGAEVTGPTEVDVAPGTVVRVPAAILLPPGVTEAAITVDSPGAPLHVAAGTVVRDVDVTRTGIATQLGAGRDDRRWVVAGRSLEGRQEEVVLVNRDARPAEVVLLLDVLSEQDFELVRTRREVGPFELAPGATRRVPVDVRAGEVRSWSATVTATGGRVIVGRVGRGDERLDLVAVTGVAADAWALPERLVRTTPRPGLVRRLGTMLGVREPGPVELLVPMG